ncbi:aromatic compound dioxygenase [Serendipita vermifera]|nr:aromatic compound dioxygenase [Serendipita vermifera]
MLASRFLFIAITLTSYAFAHAEPDTPFANQPAEVARRQLETNKRHVLARNCAAEVAAYQRERKLRRARKVRRQEETSTTSAIAPHYSTIQNFVSSVPSLLQPHVVTLLCRRASGPLKSQKVSYIVPTANFSNYKVGPYYLRDDYVRQDLREDQLGTDLYLDIGVLDITTCQPAQNVFVEIWACSAQGVYSGFGGGEPGGGDDNSTSVPLPPSTGESSSTRTRPTGFPSGSGSFSLPFPTDFPGGGGGSPPKTSNANFLRGGFMANENGTIYPGFYTGRTVHIHTMVHQDIEYHSNGTFISSSGGLRHIGQIFFDEAVNDEVFEQAVYQGSGHTRTYNDDDGILEQSNTGGYSAFAEIEKIGDSLDDGLLGYITIGIDSSAAYRISTTNYWDPNFSPAVAGQD